jgi:hypothetical protein
MQGDTARAKAAYQDFLAPLERRRPRYPHPEGSESGVREVALAEKPVPRPLLFADGLRKQFTLIEN